MAYHYSGCAYPDWHNTLWDGDEDIVNISTGWTECSIVDGHPEGAIYIEIDGVRFVSDNVELTENEGTGYIDFNDLHILN